MKKIDTIKCYEPAQLNCFEEIQIQLYNKYKTNLDSAPVNAGLATFTVPWTQDNFPVLFDELAKLNKKVITARFFIMEPGAVLRTHVDTVGISRNPYALNIPILVESSNQPMQWFWYDGEYVQGNSDAYGIGGFPADESKLTLRSTLQLTTPHYVKIAIYHRVSNFATTNRIILSIRFDDSFAA